MSHYQQLLFGCTNPRAGLAETTGIALDWPADTVAIAPLPGDQSDQDHILGVVVAMSHPEAREDTHRVALLGDLSPREVGPTALAELCLPLSADIETAMLKWEIVRFSARGLGLDLPPGRLFLVEGCFDAEETSSAEQ